jgi:uncharacterized membrane protein YgcG
MMVLTMAHVKMVLIKDLMVMALVERLMVCYYLLCFVLFWIHSVLIPTSCLYVAFDGAGNDGTDTGSHGDGVNQGSGGDGRGGASGGMLLVVSGFGIISDLFCSHTPMTS